MSHTFSNSFKKTTIADVINIVSELHTNILKHISVKNRLMSMLEKKFQAPYTHIQQRVNIHSFALTSEETQVFHTELSYISK